MNATEDALDPVRALLPDVQLEELAVLSDQERATVRRVSASGAGGERTLIVKHFHGAGEGWVRECAMLSCLPSDAPAARLVAECAEPQIAVLTDLTDPSGHTRTRGIAEALLGDDAVAAGEALARWAQGLARLHSGTRELHDAFAEQLAARAGELSVSPAPMRGELASAAELLGRHCASLGVAMPAGTTDALADVATSSTSGPCALTPADTCPDNCVEVGDDVVLVDFEGAQWRNVAWDVAYLLVPWPTCWCSWALPSWATLHALDAYREAAAPAFPEVAGSGFDVELETAVLGWTFESMTLMLDGAIAGQEPVTAEHHPTPARRAALLHRLDVAAHTTALPPLAELAMRIGAELRSRWGEEHLLPLAPAFR